MNHQVWIGFSTTNKFMSKVIRWFTRGKSSHAWIRFWDASLEQYMVMQAELHGYEMIPWKKWKTKNILIAAYEPVALNLMGGVRHMGHYLGSDYDLRSAIWTGLKRWFGRKLRRLFHSPKKLMCSEAVARALQFDKVQCVKDVNPELISPAELRGLVSASADFTEVSE